MLNLCYMGLSENGLYTTNYINNWWKIWTPSAVGFSVNMEVSSNGTPIAGWCVSMKIHENPWKCMKMPLKWMIWIDLGVPPWKCPYGNMPWEKGTGTTQMNWSILEEFLRTSGTTAWVWWSNLFAKKMRCCRCCCCRFHFLQCFSIFHWKRSDVPISMSSAGAALPPEDGTGDAGGNQLQCHGGCWCHRCHLTSSFFPRFQDFNHVGND